LVSVFRRAYGKLHVTGAVSVIQVSLVTLRLSVNYHGKAVRAPVIRKGAFVKEVDTLTVVPCFAFYSPLSKTGV
jgi:hypothetical protein